jgi:hypothetical protein
VTFHCGGDSHLVVTKSSVGTKDEQTQAAFRVADLRAEVGELRRWGVKIEDYDLPGLKTRGHDIFPREIPAKAAERS